MINSEGLFLQKGRHGFDPQNWTHLYSSCKGVRDNWIPGSCWPSYIAYLMNFRQMKNTISKYDVEYKQHRKLFPSQAQTSEHMCACVRTRTHIHTHEPVYMPERQKEILQKNLVIQHQNFIHPLTPHSLHTSSFKMFNV